MGAETAGLSPETAEPQEEPKAQFDMNAWRQGLESKDRGLAARLREDTNPYEVLEKLKLPVPEYLSFDSAAQFLADPQRYLQALQAKHIANFYVGLRTDVPEWDKFRNEEPLPADQVVEYIQSHITPEQAPHYKLRVAEYVVAACGITMIINPGGGMSIDIIDGDLGPLATKCLIAARSTKVHS
jgi:hypothetical protein